jgi:hypothetical protein
MKQVLVGILTLVTCGISNMAAAQQVPQVTAEHRNGGALLSLNNGDLTVTQTIANNVVRLRLLARGDALLLTADAEGNVTLRRGKKAAGFSVRNSSAQEMAEVRKLFLGSKAWHAFDTLMRSSWASSSRKSAAFRPAHSMVWLLQGDYRPLLSLAGTVDAIPRTIRLVRQDCDSAYASRIDEIWNELVSCLDTWNPLQTAWCAYEYNFKATWALFEYQACLI